MDNTKVMSVVPKETNNHIVEFFVQESKFGIRSANIEEHRNNASMLINKMYSWRDYGGNHSIRKEPNKITLTATNYEGETVGTVSLGIDSEIGLLVDQIFKDQIDIYRKKGKVCEIIKLAVDISGQKSKEVLASLFHVTFLYARDIHKCNEIFIEVNPRHKRFYESMLGFETVCEIRDNPRVNAPAVLMRINMEHATEQIKKHSEEKLNEKTRSFFSYFFSEEEELGIINRLKNME